MSAMTSCSIPWQGAANGHFPGAKKIIARPVGEKDRPICPRSGTPGSGSHSGRVWVVSRRAIVHLPPSGMATREVRLALVLRLPAVEDGFAVCAGPGCSRVNPPTKKGESLAGQYLS